MVRVMKADVQLARQLTAPQTLGPVKGGTTLSQVLLQGESGTSLGACRCYRYPPGKVFQIILGGKFQGCFTLGFLAQFGGQMKAEPAPESNWQVQFTAQSEAEPHALSCPPDFIPWKSMLWTNSCLSLKNCKPLNFQCQPPIPGCTWFQDASARKAV